MKIKQANKEDVKSRVGMSYGNINELLSMASIMPIPRTDTELTLMHRLIRFTFIVLVFCWAMGGTAWARTAQEILDRPNRLAEERAAWNPSPISIDEFVHPAIPLKDRYPTVAFEPRLGGTFWFWMDNRYAITSAGGEIDPATGFATPHIAIRDTESNEIYFYKKGRLVCYWDNTLTYETSELEESKRKRFSGPLGQEVEVPMFYADEQGKQVKYLIDEFDCRNIRPQEYLEKAKAKFGATENGRIRRSFEPLRPGHGFFSREIFSDMKQWWTHIGISWFKPNGEQQQLALSRTFEIGSVKSSYWSPFLGRYVFNGGVDYSRAPGGAQNPGAEYAFKARYAANVVTFSPSDGSVIKITRPNSLLDKIFAQGVLATRAGFLWTGAIQTPGLYLSQGEVAKKILDEYVDTKEIHVSPDGCKVKVMSYPDNRLTPTRMRGPLGAILDFSPNIDTTKRRNHLLLNFCKGT